MNQAANRRAIGPAARLAVGLLAVGLGGCVQTVGNAARGALLAEIAPTPPTGGVTPPLPVWKPACPGLEVDGQCEATSLRDVHPASGLPAAARRSSEERCPPTVLGVPGWCKRF